jgi:sugar lactone lactonase YvrE
MNSNLPPIFFSISSFFRRSPAMLGGVLLCVAPVAIQGQSVTFAGALTTLPTSGLSEPKAVAVDSAGDVFIAEYIDQVVELPRTGAVYAPVVTLPFVRGADSSPWAVAVDSTGNVFIADIFENRVVELPRIGAVYGPQTTLPFSGLYYPGGVAVDTAGDVFITDRANDRVLELPKTGTGYGPQITLPFSDLDLPEGVAVDSAGDVFIADSINNRVLELPKTEPGYGVQIALPFTGLRGPDGVAVDSTGDVFINDYGNSRIVKLPWTGNGYGLQTTPVAIDLVQGVAVDSTGDVFVAGTVRDNFSFYDAVLELQTHSVNFGSANVCVRGAKTPAPCDQMLTLTYQVGPDLILGTPKVLTGGAPDLDFTLASGTCTGAVTAGSTCTVNVTFTPLAAGAHKGAVEITDSGGGVITTTRISGLGVAEPIGSPAAQVSTNYLQFDDIFFGSTETKPVTVTNTGGGTLTVEPSISTYSGGPSHSYTIAGSTCGGGVTAGNSCTLQVEFSPTSIATHTALLTLQTNGSANPTVGLHGVAAGLSVLGGVSGESLSFGLVSSGSTQVLPLTVTNVGLPGTVSVDSAITVRATAHPTTTYKILTTSQNTCLAGIAAGQSCVLPVEFAPTSSGAHFDLLTVSPSNGGGKTTVWLIGETP